MIDRDLPRQLHRGFACPHLVGLDSMEALGYAHQTNEVVPVDALIKATTFYAAIPQAILVETRGKKR